MDYGIVFKIILFWKQNAIVRQLVERIVTKAQSTGSMSGSPPRKRPPIGLGTRSI